MGGGMLDTHTAMPGVLLAGCHEMQFNVKALQTKDGRVDPWMYAIVTTIKNQVSTLGCELALCSRSRVEYELRM